MNSLNALGNRHLASLNADISKLESGQAGPSLQGEPSRVPCRLTPYNSHGGAPFQGVPYNPSGSELIARFDNDRLWRPVAADR